MIGFDNIFAQPTSPLLRNMVSTRHSCLDSRMFHPSFETILPHILDISFLFRLLLFSSKPKFTSVTIPQFNRIKKRDRPIIFTFRAWMFPLCHSFFVSFFSTVSHVHVGTYPSQDLKANTLNNQATPVC